MDLLGCGHGVSKSEWGPLQRPPPASPAPPGARGLLRHQRGRGLRGGGRRKVRAPRCLKTPRAPAAAQSSLQGAPAGRVRAPPPSSRRVPRPPPGLSPQHPAPREATRTSAASPEGQARSSRGATPLAATGKQPGAAPSSRLDAALGPPRQPRPDGSRAARAEPLLASPSAPGRASPLALSRALPPRPSPAFFPPGSPSLLLIRSYPSFFRLLWLHHSICLCHSPTLPLSFALSVSLYLLLYHFLSVSGWLAFCLCLILFLSLPLRLPRSVSLWLSAARCLPWRPPRAHAAPAPPPIPGSAAGILPASGRGCAAGKR